MSQKLKTRQQIAKLAKNLKRDGKKVVTINGSFDVLHDGHVKILKAAKKYGDVLIVALNSDKSIRRYKGPTRPIHAQKKRVDAITKFDYVDYVVLFDEINSREILDEIKPNVHVNGSDWGKNCIERSTVEKNDGIIKVVKLKDRYSTSNIIKAMHDPKTKLEVRAIFFDRDGTINEKGAGYLHKPEDMVYTPRAIHGLRRLSKTDYKIIIVTNQSGIGRGYFTEKDFEKISRWMIGDLKKKNVRIDKIYHCPHLPEHTCVCRKPNIGMFEQAVKDFGISLSKSWFIGDDAKDVIAGRTANIKTIMLGKRMRKELKLEPDFYAKNLGEAANIILDKYERL